VFVADLSSGLEAKAEFPIGDRAAGQHELVAGHAGHMFANAFAERPAGQFRARKSLDGLGEVCRP
jgi:hypothetical protein